MRSRIVTLTSRTKRRKRVATPWWTKLPHQELLDVRLCDLGLRIEGTALESRVGRLHEELRRAGLRFRPYVWLSTDWFTPNGTTGFAIPFFLAHPRLARIEHAEMFEVEGGTHDWCMKLLRHEAGHAIDNAYRLHRRKRWREMFGPSSTPYRSSYVPDPGSKSHVLNLGDWYSQSHPVEDWAETFAVWLRPHSRWRSHYRDWPALAKLEFVDELMEEIRCSPAKVRSRERPESLSRQRLTLRDYYDRKKSFYGDAAQTTAYDAYLKKLFDTGNGQTRTAAAFLRQTRKGLRDRVSAMTGQYRYAIDQTIDEMITRCRKLELRMSLSAEETRLGAAILVAAMTSHLIRNRKQEFHR